MTIGLTNSQGKALPSLSNPAAVDNVLAGKDFIDLNGNRLIGTAQAKAAETITPGTANRVLTSGQILTGNQTILGDVGLVAANIKKDVNIFGVTGTFSGADIAIQLSNTNTSGGSYSDMFWSCASSLFTGASLLGLYAPKNKILTLTLSWGASFGSHGTYFYCYRKQPANQESSVSLFSATGLSFIPGQASTSYWGSTTQVTGITSPVGSANYFTTTANVAGSKTFVIPSFSSNTMLGIIFDGILNCLAEESA